MATRTYCHVIRLLQVVLLLPMLTPMSMKAQKAYKAEHLKTAALAMGVANQLEQAATGTVMLSAQDGLTIAARINEQGIVEHIGLPMFSEEIRTLIPSPIYDFLEYAVLNKKYNFAPPQ